MDRFTDRVALVTGAAQGIGRAIAGRLAREGARVILADRNRPALDEALAALADEAGGQLSAETLDVTDSGEVNALVARLEQNLDRVDVLVNNAGIVRDKWVDALEDEEWASVLAVNLTGAFYCCRAVVPSMKKRGYGRIVNISSRSWMGNPGQSNYAASKAGLVGLTRTLALELVGFGITVNAVAPGLIDTPMTRGIPDELRDKLLASRPGGRMGRPDEVAAAVAFLAAEEAGFVTGQVLGVCGAMGLGTGGVA